jgi:hypothetical protein
MARLGLDGNALRRRTDKIAAYGAAGLLALFLVGSPVVSVVVGHQAYRAAARELRDQRSWRQVSARLLATAPALQVYFSDPSAQARWTAPSGRVRTGMIPVDAGARAGSRIRIWVTSSGQLTGLPLTRDEALLRVAAEIAVTPVALATVLLLAGQLSRYLLDRRRLAGWDTDWAAVGPQWTRQFWTR